MCLRKKDGRPMCKKLADIHGKTPKELFDLVTGVPVDMNQMLEKLGIECQCVDFTNLQRRLPLKKSKILGLAYAKGNDLAIFYSSCSDPATARFTLAHELGHCCLHMNDDSSFHIEMQTIPDVWHKAGRLATPFTSKKEEAADKFARELLIPTSLFVQVLSTVKNTSIDSLAKLFSVPQPQMEKKIYEVSDFLLSAK